MTGGLRTRSRSAASAATTVTACSVTVVTVPVAVLPGARISVVVVLSEVDDPGVLVAPKPAAALAPITTSERIRLATKTTKAI